MAKKYLVPPIGGNSAIVLESSTKKYLAPVAGAVIKETVAAAPGGTTIPIFAYHYNHHLR